ncbi:MAG: hypothetical protein OXN19_05020 [Caldilineaceae bacterium]|nr:hypothetical protein [Caldilineaceae bacterium]
MMTFLFWNIKKNPLQKIIGDLAEIHEVDVFILAECEIEQSVLLTELNSRPGLQYSSPFSVSRKVTIYTRFPGDWLTPKLEEDGLSIRHFVNPIMDTDILIVAAHLRSKLYLGESDQLSLAPRWRQRIEEAEKEVGHKRTVVVGDLNMNPFDSGVISSEGFHGIMDKSIAERGSRMVSGQMRDFFYNPMWSLFGDESEGPPGSYYYDASSQPLNYYWHIFDQVLVRPELVPLFPHTELRFLTDANSLSLTNARGIPDSSTISDHLPLLFKLNI